MITLNLAIGFTAAAIVSIISLKLKFLTKSGSIAQFFLAWLIFGFGGIQWTVPILVFFITSSILSKLRNKKNKSVEDYFEKSGERDYMQVLANGGLGGIFLIASLFYKPELLFSLYVSSLAVVCADTWATEIGTLRKTKTINILNFRKVEQGTSGGISMFGTIGALLGAFIIPISSLSWHNQNIFDFIMEITAAGLFGSMVDSALGASIQAQFICRNCGKITERKIHCGKRAEHTKGFIHINNDMVNFISALAGCFFFLLLNVLLKV